MSARAFNSLRKMQSAINDATDPTVKPVALEKPMRVVGMIVICDSQVQENDSSTKGHKSAER